MSSGFNPPIMSLCFLRPWCSSSSGPSHCPELCPPLPPPSLVVQVTVSPQCTACWSVQSLSCVQLYVTPWTAAKQASLSFTISQSLLRFVSIEPEMPSNHPFLCHLLLLPSLFPSIRVFSNESVLHQVAKVLGLWLQHQSF